MDPLFNTPEVEREVRRFGYTVQPFLDEDEVRELNALHDSVTVEFTELNITTTSRDFTYRKRVYDGMTSIMHDKLTCLFPGYETCATAFATKAGRSTSASLMLHRDWSFVDHDTHTPINLWCPLCDVSEVNGTLQVIAGSHTHLDAIGVTAPEPPPFTAVEDLLIKEFGTLITLKAGGAVFYDPRLIHGSGENHTSEVRAAAICCLIPEDVTPRIYFHAESAPTRGDIYEVSPEILRQYAPGTRPVGGKHIGTFDYPFHPWDEKSLEQLRRVQNDLVATRHRHDRIDQ